MTESINKWYTVIVHECTVPICTKDEITARAMIEDFIKRGLYDLKITVVEEKQN